MKTFKEFISEGVNAGMLKSWVSKLMGNDKKTSDYSLFRKLYDDLDKDKEWINFAKEITSKKIDTIEKFQKYIKDQYEII